MKDAAGVAVGLLKGLGVAVLAVFMVVSGLRECGVSVEPGQSSKCESVARDTAAAFSGDQGELRAVGWASCMHRNGWACSTSGRIPGECRHSGDVADNPFLP